MVSAAERLPRRSLRYQCIHSGAYSYGILATVKPKPRGAIYVRISKDVRDRAGVQRQEKLCRELAADRGFEVVEPIFDDNDRSASRKRVRRPAFDSMLESIRTGEIDVVLAYATDRLWRRPDDLERLIEAANVHDVAVVTVTSSDVGLSTARDRMVAGILAQVSKAEVELTGERQQARHRQRRENGLDAGGRRAFGYREDRMRPLEREARHVREAYSRVLAGETVGVIANDWRRRRITTTTGKPWREENLRKMLARPRYAGLIPDPKTGVIVGLGGWSPIVDRETFDATQKVLSVRRPKTKPRPFLLTGFIVCGRCGHELRGQAGDYLCAREVGGAGNRAEACGRLRVKGSDVDNMVGIAVATVLSGRAYRRRLAVAKSSDGFDAKAAKVAQLEDRLGEINEMFAAGEITRGELRVMRARVRDLLDVARVTAGASLDAEAALNILPEIERPAEWWNAATITDRRRVLSVLIEKIIVSPAVPGAPRRFDPNRVLPVWKV